MRGIRLDGKKESSLNPWTIHKLKYCGTLRVPLIQSRKGLSSPIVRIGEYVHAGQKIAQAEGPLGLPVFAGWSGTVTAIESFPHVYLDSCVAVEIKCDEQRKMLAGTHHERADWENLSSEQLAGIFHETGLIEMDEDPISIPRKFTAYRENPVDVLLINGCENEPYVTSDYALMMSNPVEVLKGVEILRRAAGAREAVIAVLDDKLEAAEVLKSKIYFLKWNHIRIEILPNRYPQGLAAPLMKSLFGEDIISDVIRLRRMSPAEDEAWLYVQALAARGYALHNVATAFAAYEAVVMQKPLYERAVTVSGECVIQPHNFWFPFGYEIEEAFKRAKGFMREPGRVLVNGPMQGRALATLKAGVVPAVRALLGLPKELVEEKEAGPCTHCNECVEVCPMDISPVMITLAAERGLFEDARDWGAEACIFCGNCEYACPSNRPMSELVEKARFALLSGKRA